MKERLASLNWSKWFKNTALFFTPVALTYLVFVQINIDKDGFQMNDFVPTAVVIGSMVNYVLNSTIDFIKKYRAANPEK